MQAYVVPGLLLILSNTFMTFAWYGFLGYDKKPLWIMVLACWGVAFLEYCFMVPANRIGHQAGISTGQLKVMQEVITLVVFAVFSWAALKEKLTWNYYVAFVFVLAAVFMVFYFKPGGGAKKADAQAPALTAAPTATPAPDEAGK